MYNHGTPEETIQVRTGHKSINGLRVYEQPGLEQQWEACEAIADVANKQGRKNSGLDIYISHENILAQTIHRPTFPPLQFANSGVPVLPPSLTFSGCSVNVFKAQVYLLVSPKKTSASFDLCCSY